jgi:cytochrome c oxidase assembly factor CtaG
VAAGLATLAVALSPPLDSLADTRLPFHMVQHVLLTMVAAPLLAAGMTRLPRLHPVATWLLFAATGWVVHFTGLFEAAAEHLPVHVFEHALLFGTALLFWAAVVGPRPTMSHPLRLLYLAVAMPQNTFLALAITSADTVLYPHYAGGGDPLGEQRLAGGIMWIAGDLLLLLAVLLMAAAWARHEERENLLFEQEEDAQRTSS